MTQPSRRLALKLSALAIAGAALSGIPACARREPIAFEGTELREYQGEELSSILDSRENSIRGPQRVSLDTYRLSVSGLVDRPLTLTYDDTLALRHISKVVTLHCVEGWEVKILWEGVLISELLEQAAPRSTANTAIFHAVDGYTSSLPLKYIVDRSIILADKMNDVVLPPERGFPFHVVAEGSWGYKSVRWVKGIELTSDPLYRGYWESQGYNNLGDYSGPKLDRVEPATTPRKPILPRVERETALL